MEITVTHKRNAVATVTPTNWEAFEAARDARYDSAVNNPTIGFKFFLNSVAARLSQGRRYKWNRSK